MVRSSISNHHPSGKHKKPKPRHTAPCLRQLDRYKLYEIRLETLKKRRYAPAEPSRAEPSRAENSRCISIRHSQVLLPYCNSPRTIDFTSQFNHKWRITKAERERTSLRSLSLLGPSFFIRGIRLLGGLRVVGLLRIGL